MMEKRLTETNLLAALLLGLLVTWVLYGLFGHRLIDALYTSEWLQDRIMAERAFTPLAAYYQKADEIMLVWLLRFLTFFPLLLIFIRKPGPALLFFLITLSVYSASTAPIGLLGQQSQATELHYSYLADSLLNGRLDIVLTRKEANGLSEVVVYGDKCYVLFPPMPAILLMPLVLVFGRTFPTALLSISLAAVSVALTYVLLRRATFSEQVSAWVTVLFGFGTTFWYTSLNGSVWFLAQITGIFFLLLALVEVHGRKRPLLIGVMIGAATLSRLPLLLSTPFFLYLLLQDRKQRVRNTCAMLLGVGLFCGLNMLYNWARFGTIRDAGYYMIPEVLYAPWYKNGIFDIRYIPRNIYALLFQPPVLVDHFPYIVPTVFGLALLFTTPALLLIFKVPGGEWTRAVLCTVFVVSLPSLLHGWPGSAQFGYRFSLDYTPFLMLLTARAIGTNISKRAISLIVLSCAISIWGLRYNTWIEPKWLFDIGAYYKNVHPHEAEINSVCVAQQTP